jgi:archaellum biogenesis ATPase FlaH
VWLSNVGRDNAIRPKDLEKLSVALEQFLSQSGGGIVLLDGLEYLITNNNFITVLRLIQSLRDQVAINQSILLMAVNRSTLESHQLNLLEREVDYTISG